ncbi:MAG: hypothetical protein EOO41_00115, partial [Methanobacteriota archaeon]
MPTLPHSSAFRGLTSSAASVRLSQAARDVLRGDVRRLQREARMDAASALCSHASTPSHIASLCAAGALFVAWGVGVDGGDSRGSTSILVAAIAVVLGIVGNVALVLWRLHQLRWEVHSRVVTILLEFERACALYNKEQASVARDLLASVASEAGGGVAPQPGAATHAASTSATAGSPAAAGFRAVTFDGIVFAAADAWQAIDYHDTNKSVYTIPTYRDGQWVRLPPLLLVKGDLIALMANENAPGRVKPVEQRAGSGGPALPRAPVTQPAVDALAGAVRSGDDVAARVRQLSVTSVATAASHSVPPETSKAGALPSEAEAEARGVAALQRSIDSNVLTLCGDMRRFVLLETPLVNTLQKRLRAPHRPQPLFFHQLRQSQRLVQLWQVSMVVLGVAVVVIRSMLTGTVPNATWGGAADAVLVRSAQGGFVGLLSGLLQETPILLLAFVPSSFPFFLVFAEVLATASLLAVHESALLRAKWKAWRKSLVIHKVQAEREAHMNGEAQEELGGDDMDDVDMDVDFDDANEEGPALDHAAEGRAAGRAHASLRTPTASSRSMPSRRRRTAGSPAQGVHRERSGYSNAEACGQRGGMGPLLERRGSQDDAMDASLSVSSGETGQGGDDDSSRASSEGEPHMHASAWRVRAHGRRRSVLSRWDSLRVIIRSVFHPASVSSGARVRRGSAESGAVDEEKYMSSPRDGHAVLPSARSQTDSAEGDGHGLVEDGNDVVELGVVALEAGGDGERHTFHAAGSRRRRAEDDQVSAAMAQFISDGGDEHATFGPGVPTSSPDAAGTLRARARGA